jgi:prepilin-type N-terminal cleavage/methylation domain-containing protein
MACMLVAYGHGLAPFPPANSKYRSIRKPSLQSNAGIALPGQAKGHRLMTTRIMKKKGAGRGFTLLEIMAVVAILGILLACSIPQLFNMYNGYKLTGAVDAVQWAISSTRYQAIMNGYYYQLTISNSAMTTQVLSKVPPAASFSNVGSAVPITSAPVTISPATTTYQFSPSGGITVIAGNSNPNTITVTYSGTTHTITVSNYGQITIQ